MQNIIMRTVYGMIIQICSTWLCENCLQRLGKAKKCLVSIKRCTFKLHTYHFLFLLRM